MKLLSRHLGHFLVLALAVVCLAWPARGHLMRVVTYFAATFDGAVPHGMGPGSSFEPAADVGRFTTTGPPGVFSQQSDGAGDGFLLIDDSSLQGGSAITAHFVRTFIGTALTVRFALKPHQDSTSLTFRLADDADTGVIDLNFGPNGGIDVDGTQQAATYAPNVEMQVEFELFDPMLGPAIWKLEIEGPGIQFYSSGPLDPGGGAITLDRVIILRPAGTPGGVFEVDDLFVTAPNMAFVK